MTTGSKIQRYIPTPDASRTIPEKEYRKNYNKRFKEPSALIRFSATVEDSIGCPYVMDEQDDAFLKQYNANRDSPLSEDDFEKVMWQFESTVNQHWPHLNLVSTNVFPFHHTTADLHIINRTPPSSLPLKLCELKCHNSLTYHRIMSLSILTGKPADLNVKGNPSCRNYSTKMF